jgi:hypothetical protein
MDFLRINCSTESLFSAWVEPNNVSAQTPTAILGNQVEPGDAGNPFDPADANADTWYEVTILNNVSDSGFAAGDDTDGTVVLRVLGHGPGNTVAGVEVEVKNDLCLAEFCEQEFAQKNVTARNDTSSACSARVSSGTLRTFAPGN